MPRAQGDEGTADITIRLRENGPPGVESPVQILAANGTGFTVVTDKPTLALCRRRVSQKKPFCDGSHKAHRLRRPNVPFSKLLTRFSDS
ncbi:MAG: hypothetical protein CMJ81_19810 [Planctomycetaceae bacterium]|nr:hypothetical protein [Planctomycetaceae bacterium]MBP59999.1 hypothetical protein [Planctomycetaceae bacterium]